MLGKWLSYIGSAPKPSGPHASLKVALVADELTASCLDRACSVVHLTPSNFGAVLRSANRPDFVFIESAWQGYRHTWKYRIAAYPEHADRNNLDLARLIDLAREHRIPTVFWNKEDGAHFDRFIASARLADVILTVDTRCVERYRAVVGNRARVGVLPFAVHPSLHRYTGIDANRHGACFVGSYGTHIHDARRSRQDLLLAAAARRFEVDVYDRNSDRRAVHYRFPVLPGLRVRDRVPHARTADVYRRHFVCLNVNTIEDSETMLSRRLVEILACGGLAVSTPALAIEQFFPGCCHVVESAEHADEVFARLARDGYNNHDRAMIESGVRRVLAAHTYDHRLDTILEWLSPGGK
jgi:spore maturation protein CgeB